MTVEVYKIDQSPNRDVILIRVPGDTAYFPANASLINPIEITGGGTLGPDLTAIEALTGTSTIYYRSATNTWSPVIIGSGLSFIAGTLSFTGTTGSSIIISGSGSGSYQPLNSDLTAIAALTGNGTLYYRASNGIWSPVTFASSIIFSGGMISGSGLIGATGPTGPSGATGATGPSGSQGLQGIPGTGISIVSGTNSYFSNIIVSKLDLTRPFPHNTAPGHGTPSGTVNYPAGSFKGIDDKNTILVFPRQTGYLVSTEEFGRNTISTNSYVGGLSGNTCNSPVIYGFTIDGSGNINVQSRIYNSGDPYIATGLAIEAMSPQISNISFFDIRGTALYVDGPHQTSGDDLFPQYWRGDMAFIKDIYIVGGFAGAVIKTTDTKIQNFYSVNVRDIGLDVYGASLIMSNSHIYGASTGVVVRQDGLVANNIYWEECTNVCLDLIDSANGCLFNNLFTGPNGALYRTIRIATHGNDFRGVKTNVRPETTSNPDIAGLEITSNSLYNNCFQGQFNLNSAGSTSKAVILRGKQGTYNLKCGSNSSQSGSYVVVSSAIEGNDVNIKGHGKGGIILNLSGSSLNTSSGYGNDIKITWEKDDLVGSNAITGIMYPGGGLAWNLEEGTSIKFQGKQLPQSKDNLMMYLRMNETTGNAIDAYSSNTLTQHGGVSNNSGLIYSTTRSFNGTNQYLDITSNSSFCIGPKDVFSALIWINLAAKSSYMGILTKDDIGSNREYNLYYDVGNDALAFEFYNGSFSPVTTLRVGNPISINTWYMVYMEYNGATVRMNLNNGSFTSASFASTPFSGSASFNLGNWSNVSNYYSGLIGPVRFYKRTLTEIERTTFYDNGFGFK